MTTRCLIGDAVLGTPKWPAWLVPVAAKAATAPIATANIARRERRVGEEVIASSRRERLVTSASGVHLAETRVPAPVAVESRAVGWAAGPAARAGGSHTRSAGPAARLRRRCRP